MLKKLLGTVLSLLLLAVPLRATNIVGTISAPQTNNPLRNASLTFTLNQAAVLSGTASIVTTPARCYTDQAGALKGLPNVLAAPTAVPNYASGTVPSGTYYVALAYYDSNGTTLPGPVTTVVMASTGKIDVTGPAVQPTTASGYRVYAGTVPTTLKLQVTATSYSSTSITAYDASGTPAVSTNGSICEVYGNDTLIPSYTTYRVTATSSTGTAVPGFPQQWYVAGTTLNISTAFPIATNVQTRFPMPLIANPQSQATQSINSPLTLNGYGLTAGSILLPDNDTPPTPTVGTVYFWNDTGILHVVAGDISFDLSATITALANSATPSVDGQTNLRRKFITGGTTAITDFTGGVVGTEIVIIAEHSLTITDGTNIFLAGSANFAMQASDTLTLIQKADSKWYELDRSDN